MRIRECENLWLYLHIKIRKLRLSLQKGHGKRFASALP